MYLQKYTSLENLLLPYICINSYFLTLIHLNYSFAVNFIGESKNSILFDKKNNYNSISMKCPE